MKLPAIPFLTKTVSVEFFLALIIESDKISSILFKEQEKTLVIIASSEIAIETEEAPVEDLVVASDNVISRVELSLPENANLEKTIFTVPYSWVHEGKIKPERLSQLKKISVELALTPMGFIISIEAVVAFLQKKEGAPITGIFVELSEHMLTVFIVRNSNVIEVKHGLVEDSVESTVEKLLGKVVSLDVLPPKIVLMHSHEAEEISQKFLSYHWTKELSFRHLPQVEILDRSFENEAIISGVASQLNVTVKGDINVLKFQEVMDEEEEISGNNSSFGFLKDKDVAEHPKEEEKEIPKSLKEETFAFSETVENVEPVIRHHGVVKSQSDEGGEEVFEEDKSDEHEHSSRNKLTLPAAVLSSFSSFFTPKTLANLPKIMGSGRKILIPFVALALIVLLLIAYYSVILKAHVVIFTDQKAFKEDSMDITLSANGNSSFSDKTLKISTTTEEVQGEESQETTGQKDTGQKASGTITIFNKTEDSKQINKGTIVTSSNNLNFTLNDDVNIASTSSFATSFSSAQAKVTASNFGKEYNIPSQTNFTIKGVSTSDLFGRNDNAFSGGTKEQIQVVSLKDLTDLANTVTNRLFDKAKSQAETKLSSTDALIPSYISFDFKDKTYDKKENDQAKNVKLTATIDYTLGIYKKDELANFITSSSDFNVPKDFKFSDAQSSITITDIKQGKNDMSAKLSFNAIFKPQLDEKAIPQQITGHDQMGAVKKLKSISGISDVTVVLSNNIPFLPQLLPFNKGNITVEYKAQ